MKMMKKFLAFAILATMLASCNNEEVFDSLKDTPISVTAGVAELTTRAGYVGTTVLPTTFYLSVDQEGTNYDYTDVQIEKNGETYTPKTPMLWKDSNQTSAAVKAYTIPGSDVSVAANQGTIGGVTGSDLLGAISTTSGDVTIAGNNIALRFRHLLCKLDVTYSWGTEFNGNTTKSINSVVYSGFGTSATLNREDCTIEANGTTGDINAYVSETISEAIFAPKTSSPKIVIIATIDGVDREFALNITAPSDGWKSGNCYTMNVSIGGETVDAPTVTATGWGSSINGGNMETE